MRSIKFLTPLALVIPMMCAEAFGAISSPLTVYPANPRYWANSGVPVVVLGAGQPLPGDKTGDYRADLDAMAAHKVNYARVWHLLVWSAPDAYLPWARDGVGTANDGLPKYDLTHWDSNFWTRLKDACAYAQSKGIIMSVMLFDECGIEAPISSSDHRWNWHPFNPQNNVNGLSLPTSPDAIPEFYSLTNAQLKSLQEQYVAKLIAETSIYPNVVYEICNEYTGPWDWEKYWIDFVTARCSNLITVNRLGTMPSNYWSDPGIDMVKFHYNTTSPSNINSNMAANYSQNRATSYDETPEISSISFADYTGMLWSAFTAGGHIHLENGYNPTAALDAVLYIRDFIDTNGVRFWEMQPNNGLVTATPGGTAYTLAKPGSEYVSYISGSGGGSMTVSLQSGMTYTAKAYNPSNGVYTNLTVNGNTISGIPSYSSDIAVYIKANSAPPPPASSIAINGLSANMTTIGRYERYELTFNLSGLQSNCNPFRPETVGDSLSGAGVDVHAEVITPSGQTKTAWGYYDVDYTYLGPASNPSYRDRDRLVPTRLPHWHIRYAPEELGTYRVTVKATDQSGTATSSQLTFTCVASDKKGFVRISSDGSRFVYSDGSPFVPFGIQSPYGAKATDKAMADMKANGMNFIRRWLVNRSSDDIFREFESWEGNYATDDTTYRSGARSAIMSPAAPGFVVQHVYIGCKPNTYYKAYVYLKTSSDFNGKSALEITEEQGDGSTKVYAATQIGAGQNWVLSEVIFQTASNAEFIHFRPKVYNGSAGVVWADDAGVYECDSAGNITMDWNMVFNPSFELWTPAQLRLVALGRFEHMLQVAEDYGIEIQPCIFDYRLWYPTNPIGFYASFFGDFFTDSASIAQQRRVLRYLVARFSSYRSLFAWELTNEMDPTFTPDRGKWVKGHADFLRQNDPQRQMVTNSLWHSPGDVGYAQIPEQSINQVHFYLDTEERVGGQGVPAWGQQSAGVVIDTTASNAYSGSRSLKFTANGNTLAETESIYCKPGWTYTLRYRLKLSGINGSAAAIVRAWDVNGVQLSTPVNQSDTGSFSYATREKTFTLPSTATYITLELRVMGAAGTAWYDAVEVIDNTTGADVGYNGGFESPSLGDDEYEWALYNTIRSVSLYEAGPGGTRKPWASGETGLMGANADLSYWARPGDTTKPRHDSTGIHVHNSIWAQLMASSALNTPSYWWVDEYIIPFNLWYRWKGAAAFAAKLPFYDRGQRIATAPYPAEVQANSTDARIRVLGQQGSNSAYVWIQNSQNTWSRVVRDGINPTPLNADLTIPGFTNNTAHTIEWYDTVTGDKVNTETKTPVNGVLTLTVTGLSRDVAAIITSGTSAPPSPEISLTISADKATALPNDVITYTVAFTNTGTDTAVNVAIRLPVPANTTYVTGSGGTYDAPTNSVLWTVPSLAAGASGQFTAKVRVN